MRKTKTAYDPRQLEFTSLVGGFFENTAQRLLNATTCHYDTGDLIIPEIRVAGEVKSGNSRHPLRIRLDQLRAHQKLLDTNTSLRWYTYCLFTYNGKESKVGCRHKYPRSQLARCTNEKEFLDFITGRNINTYIVDIELLSAAHKAFGDIRGGVLGRPAERHLCLSHRYMKRFKYEGIGPLGELKIDHHHWIVDSRKILLPVGDCSRSVRLDVTCVLPKKLYRKVSNVMYSPPQENEPF